MFTKEVGSIDDIGGFEEFTQAEAPRLLGLAYALTGNPHDAWDLTQETLVRLGERWRRIETTGNPAGYARTVIVRLNIDRIRRLRRELRPGRMPDSPVPEPDLGVEAWLIRALATLSPKQRTALALRHIEDLDITGIADRMGCSAGTVKSHLSRGSERLRQYAAEAGIGPDRAVTRGE